jgi:(p)ppGpp synthase/HD superfamily hydrolase
VLYSTPAGGLKPGGRISDHLEACLIAYSARYDAALILAIRAHSSQVRKGSDIPYASHPIHVSIILLRYGFPEDVAIAGLLHDVVEDQEVSLASIEAGFGPAVAEMVASVTERKQEGGAKRPWKVRKQEALEHMRGASLDAVALKAADVLHNVRSLAAQLYQTGPATWTAFSRGPEDALWYYRSVAALARERLGPHPLIEEMEEAVRDLECTIAEVGAA